MRSERLYLQDIIEAAEHIREFVRGLDEGGFAANELVVSGILQKLMIIGEAASHVSEGTRQRHPEIPWPQIVGFRNYAIHAYFALRTDMIWTTVTQDIPVLAQQIASIIREMPPEN